MEVLRRSAARVSAGHRRQHPVLRGLNGWASALSTTNGHLIWHRRIGTLAAASPALDIRHKLVFFALLSTSPGTRRAGNGAVVALLHEDRQGRVVASLPSGSESSPLVHGLSVFLGDQGGTVYSFRTYDGHLNWAFGDGGGQGWCRVRAQHALFRRLRRCRCSRSMPPTAGRSGRPAAATLLLDAGGRVRAGVHRKHERGVYAFWATSGARAWSASTGGIRLRLAGGGRRPRTRADRVHRLVRRSPDAYGADSGGVRWSHGGGGRIDGSATVVGNVVYYSSLGRTPPTGLDLRTGGRCSRSRTASSPR